jgi:hypothetical protein
MKYHMRLDIKGTLINRSFKGFQDDNGKDLNPKEVERNLLELLSQGKKYLPMGGCDNFDEENGCLGHPDNPTPSLQPKE